MEELKGVIVWVPCEQQVWRRAEIIRQISTHEVEVNMILDDPDDDPIFQVVDVATVAKLAGETSDKAIPICNDLDRISGVDDMTTLNHLHEPAVLQNLSIRFNNKMPYTYTGNICIAVNPYQWLDLYDKSLYKKYLEMQQKDLPPHPFSLSARSYREMTMGIEQSILVSGESGAGKTETVKIMMNHLASISGGGTHSDITIDKVLKSNPLLESFGNAKTKRNDNSSRFGKFAQLQFNDTGLLIGARIETYLLEKNRVVQQSLEERNYHIFYQLLSLGDEERKHYKLTGNVEDYEFVKSGSFTNVDGKSDSELLQATKDAMNVIGIESHEQHGIFEIVAGILHLGQIRFSNSSNDDGGEQSKVDNVESLEIFSNFLKTGVDDMKNILSTRSMVAGSESYSLPLNGEQSTNLRDAFAKGIYSYMFDWLVGRINRSICSTKQVASHIGLLDIFGFESFDRNSFEQLCINYANEKLQQKFIKDVFKTVKEEYITEEIPLTLVSFNDNQPILDLIEGKLGIVSLLNEEVVRPMATDASFVNKVLDTHGNHSNLDAAKFNKMVFTINHYAGDVMYNGEGFLEKNKDTLPKDLVDLLSSSSSELVSEIFCQEEEKITPSTGGKRNRGGYLVGNTIAGSFRKQLSELMDTIAKTSVQYVRCIKPNSNKTSGEYNRHLVAEQLQCAGVIAAIRISRASYPTRMKIQEFENRFQILCAKEKNPATSHEMVMSVISNALPEENFDSAQNERFAIGKTRVYFSSGLLQQLEAERTVQLQLHVIHIQSKYRSWSCRKRYITVLNGLTRLQSTVKRNRQRRQYFILIKGVVLLQSVSRRRLQQKLYLNMRESHRKQMANKKEIEKEQAEKEQSKKEEAERQAKQRVAQSRKDQYEDPKPIAADENRKTFETTNSKGPLETLSSASEKVAAAENAAREAQSAAAAAAAMNKDLKLENEALKSKLSSNVAEFADADLLRENERLKQQVATLQSQLMRAQEVSLISATVVDSRITYREGRQFVEYKLQIDTNTRGTLYVWHRYSTFRNLAATLQSKNGYKRKEIPELPSKQLFGNFSEKVIQDRVERLNMFLDAATKADYLQWGIRVDQDTCVYKRRVKSSASSRDTVITVDNDEDGPSRQSKGRFSFRRSQAA